MVKRFSYFKEREKIIIFLYESTGLNLVLYQTLWRLQWAFLAQWSSVWPFWLPGLLSLTWSALSLNMSAQSLRPGMSKTAKTVLLRRFIMVLHFLSPEFIDFSSLVSKPASNNSTISECPWLRAMCNGVSPDVLTELRSESLSTIILQISA